MNNIDYIRKGVKLADGFSLAGLDGFFIDLDVPAVPFPYHIKVDLELPPTFIKDALAAQLVRQVDAIDRIHVSTIPASSEIWESIVIGKSRDAVKNLGSHCGPDRNMNTIIVIVDSGVLDTGESNGT